MQTTTAQACTMCGSPAPNLCKQCQSSWYCSHACQRADWPVHKLLCSSFTSFHTRPDATSKRGIFFPVGGNKPEFVWVPCELVSDDDDGTVYESFDMARFLGDDLFNRVWVQRNNTRSRAREDVLTVYLRDAGFFDGSLLNRSVIAAARGRYVNFGWPGPLLVVRSSGLTLGDSELVDVDMVDLRDAVDVLCSYPDVNINFAAPEATWEVDTVRVNCIGVMTLYGRPQFEAVKVPRDHAVLDHPVAGISRLLGFGVRVVMCSRHKSTRDYDCTNREATALQLDPDPSQASWGRVPASHQVATEEWPYMGGNVVVVREDRGTLREQHVEALCHFCLHVILPLCEQSRQGKIPIQRVMDKLTQSVFERYWRDYCRQKRGNWENVESPV